MTEAELYIKSHESKEYFAGLKAACEYLEQDGNGLKGLRAIIDGIKKTKSDKNHKR